MDFEVPFFLSLSLTRGKSFLLRKTFSFATKADDNSATPTRSSIEISNAWEKHLSFYREVSRRDCTYIETDSIEIRAFNKHAPPTIEISPLSTFNSGWIIFLFLWPFLIALLRCVCRVSFPFPSRVIWICLQVL